MNTVYTKTTGLLLYGVIDRARFDRMYFNFSANVSATRGLCILNHRLWRAGIVELLHV